MMVLDHHDPQSASMAPQEEARYRCPSCPKTFVRKAHMLRHQQQHGAQKPFSCHFCSKSFKRSDVLRAHQFRCKERGDAPVPEGQSKGRKRSSCSSCVKLRTKCDQETPCSRCVDLGKECVRAPSSYSEPPRREGPPRPKSRDAIPIAHLLNSPPDDDFGGRFPVPGSLDKPEDDASTIPPEVENASEMSHWSEDVGPPYDAYTTRVDNTGFNSFFDGLENLTFNNSIYRSEVMPAFEPMVIGMPDARLQAYETRAEEVRHALHTAAVNYGPAMPDPQDMLSLSPTINSLTGTEIALLVDLFFQHYHKHCPILHRPSFDLTVVPLGLLVAVIALGGMYAPDKPRMERMRSMLDVMELYIFNLDGLREEFPFSSDLSQAPDDITLHAQFQILQGGYLVIVAQYFSGNLQAKRRARRQRYTRVLDVARSFKLPSAQHITFPVINDEHTFHTWIRQENRIRFMNVMIAFDAAMAIFNNVPPRLTFAEIDLMLPCEQHFWEMSSYAELMSQQLFPRPRPKLMDMFQLLFLSTTEFYPEADKISWNCWDMLYLVHLLYCHVWRQTFSNPMLRKSPYTTPAPANILEPLKDAIRNWKSQWDDVRGKLSAEQLQGMGFETSADSYWTLTKLILQAFDTNNVKGGTNYTASVSDSASETSPIAEQSSTGTPVISNMTHRRQPSGQSSYSPTNDQIGSSTNGTHTNGAQSSYHSYNLATAQAGMVPITTNDDIAMNMNMIPGQSINTNNYIPPQQRFEQPQPPLMVKRESSSIVHASGLPSGLGLTGNYFFNISTRNNTVSSGRAGRGAFSEEPTSATTTDFGGGIDFMPLEADCDTQGAHLKKILRAARA